MAVRDGAMAILKKRGEWVAPPAFGPQTARVQKAAMEEFRIELFVADEKSGPAPANPYRLQIWWQGQQVAHMEWTGERALVDCRVFKRGEWREDLAAIRP